MIDSSMIYGVIYALAARDGRSDALFGPYYESSAKAFARSLAGTAFPEIWFELPLKGEPWFDLHVLTHRDDLEPGAKFTPGKTGGNPDAFEWFAAQGSNVRQMALSWDIGSGSATDPAIQLLVNTNDAETTCGFLAAAGKPDAIEAYRAFSARLPQGWYACYAGVFPTRRDHNLRVECIPSGKLQEAYARDAGLLKEHLLQVGFTEFGSTLVPRCQELARSPLQLEFQFDVEVDGKPGSTFGASSRYIQEDGGNPSAAFGPDGAGGALLRLAESWGLADDRWRMLSQTAFAKTMKRDDDGVTVFCMPAFLKLRWRNGDPLDAKTYLIAGLQ